MRKAKAFSEGEISARKVALLSGDVLVAVQTKVQALPAQTPHQVAMAPKNWRTSSLPNQYIPKIGNLHLNGVEFTTKTFGDILSIDASCARDKSTATHEYVIHEDSQSLLLSANILYGTALTSDVKRTASYKQAAEKWNSDSDSDESDEEELKV